MRPASLSILTLTLAAALGAVAATSSASARIIESDCGPSYVRCGTGYAPVCQDDGRWACIPDGSSSSEEACGPNNVRCMEGYDPICGDDGRWQCQLQPSECGASSILCAPGTMPECRDGEWGCVPQAAESCEDATPIYCFQGAPICKDGEWHCPSTVGPLEIDRLSPDSGRAGQRVVISGQSFTRTGNTVYFDGSVIDNLRSRQNGTKLVFRVPAQTTLPCLPFCKIAVLPYGPGEYDVSVENRGGAVSNSLTFTITGTSSSSKSSSSSSIASCTCPAGQAWTENGCTEMEMMCPMYYVEGGWCGCDGEVYGNSCIAAANGVMSGAPCKQL